jgi:hypothetical protein
MHHSGNLHGNIQKRDHTFESIATTKVQYPITWQNTTPLVPLSQLAQDQLAFSISIILLRINKIL